MSYKDEIVKTIKKLSGKYNPSIVFQDWVTMMALAFQNNSYILHNDLWKRREEQYRAIANKYDSDELEEMCKMMGLLTKCFEEGLEDYLGSIYMESNASNKNLGQFFTPYHLSKAVARVGLDIKKAKKEKIKLNEPSSGSGGMIIAYMDLLKEHGINYQSNVEVVAQDLDWLAVYMTYVQLTMIGVKATVYQGNTLKNVILTDYAPECVFKTPFKMGWVV